MTTESMVCPCCYAGKMNETSMDGVLHCETCDAYTLATVDVDNRKVVNVYKSSFTEHFLEYYAESVLEDRKYWERGWV